MARAVGVRIEGLREVVRDLEALGVEIDDLKDAFSKISTEAAQIASGFVRSRTGRLAGTVRGNRAKSKAVVTAGRARAPYAGPINYGWSGRNIQGQFFMQRASAQMEPKAVVLLEAEIEKVITRKGLR